VLATTACIGLRAKTGRAIAVVVAGPASSLQALLRTELTFATMEEPALFQPYHQVMDLPWPKAARAVQEPTRLLEAAAARSLETLLAELRSKGIAATGVAVVGAPERNLEAIGSPHIRAHAAEGVLFRHVLQAGAAAHHLPCAAFAEKGFEAHASSLLGLSLDVVQDQLADFGRSLGRPWRADEKAAALAAWVALATPDAA
jgi:hypothetical protein